MQSSQHTSVKTALTQARQSLASQLGLNSLRGRYVYAVILFILFLLASAQMAATRVDDATRFGVSGSAQRLQIQTALRAVANDIWAAEYALQGYLLTLDPTLRRDVHGNLEKAQAQFDTLSGSAWVKKTPRIQENLQRLAEYLKQLSHETEHVMALRGDPEKLFPAMPILQNSMLPAYTDFYTAASFAMEEADEERDKSDQAEIYRLFSEARHASTLMIGTFRNWIANRFAIFGDAETAMRAQASNIVLYAERVDDALDKLSRLNRQGRLSFRQIDAIEKMPALHKSWLKSYREVSTIFTSDRWRLDTPLLRDTIHPLFGRIWETVHDIGKEVDAYSSNDTAVLSQIADHLLRTLWWLTLVAVALTVAGYFFFEYGVRKPVGRVTDALKQEAAGKQNVTLVRTHTRETDDLISAFDHMRQQIHSRQLRLETILDNAAEGIVTFDANGVIESFNHAAQRLFGYSETEIVGRDIGMLIPSPNGEKRQEYAEHFMRTEIQNLVGHEGEVIGRHKDGAKFPMAIKINTMQLEGRQLFTGLVADISERKAMVEHLKNMAEHDGLTGLYNRSYFQQELERVVERVKRAENLGCALLYIDLDNFKYINDTMGHASGDRLIIEVAGILNKRARKSDLISRFGGDEFTVLLFDITPTLAVQIAESFRVKLADYPFRHEGKQIDIGCSIGVATVNAQTVSAAELMSQADLACHIAKRGGRNCVHLFNSADAENVTTMSLDMGWSRRIKEALEKDRFVLACQPIVSTRTHEVESYEVLIRMLDERNELIMPAGFLPAAERFGLASDIDKWVVTHAIESLALLRVKRPSLRYSVNLSGRTLTTPGICDLIKQKLTKSGLDPSALTFEVTETVAIADMAAAEILLSELQSLGCKTALDDFGSGMASFAYLKDLPIDYVKIDGRFVKNLASNPVDQAMVRAMNEIAHALGKKTIAEFVENAESFRLLGEYGVDFGQGYHLGRPEVSLPCESIDNYDSKGCRTA